MTTLRQAQDTTTIMPGIRQVTQLPKRVYRRKGVKVDRTRIELYAFANGAESEVRYREALKLVKKIDEDLTRKTRHYRTRAGVLLTCLDEVVEAMLLDNLKWEEENNGHQRTAD